MNNKKTDLEQIKKYSKMLFDMVDFSSNKGLEEYDGLFICHPYCNCRMVVIGNDFIDLLADDNNIIKFRQFIFDLIDKADDFYRILLLLQKNYRYTWFKLIEKYLDTKDFSKLLGIIWVESENPNQDANVSLKESISFFKRANKKYLMSSEDYKIYKDLPDELIVYRGISNNNCIDGLSYTKNLDKALWFMNRFSNPVALITAIIKKEDILAYFNTRDEDEIVINSFNCIKKDIQYME